VLEERYNNEIKGRNVSKNVRRRTLEEIFTSNFEALIEYFRGLDSYTELKYEKLGVNVSEVKRLKGKDTSCLTLMMLAILVVLGLVVIFLRYETKDDYWLANAVRSPLESDILEE
jgi:hypothetical protein